FILTILLSISLFTPAHAQPTPTPVPQPTSDPRSLAGSDVPRGFDRTIVLMLGGVTWHDWLRLTRGFGSDVSLPGLRKVLEQGHLAAARLPGAPPDSEPPPSGQFMKTRISPPLLRAAATLSSGIATGELGPVPLAAAVTLGVNERWIMAAPTFEDAPPALAYARRVEWPVGWRPNPDALLNLGWGMLMTPSSDELRSSRFGALGDAIHAARRRTVALGSGDTSLRTDRGIPLREWAVVAAGGRGVVDGGDVSGHLMAPDRNAPFGVRVNQRAMLKAFDQALGDPRTALIAIEWGDTRRAALYAPWCAPEIAASYRESALRHADFFIRAVVGTDMHSPRLTYRDRLVVLCVPDIDTNEPQWLPLAYWQPEQVGQGALLQARWRGEQPGVVPLESVFATILARVNAPLPADTESASEDTLIPVGGPSRAADRVGRLLALQSGFAWLDAARPLAHGLWTAFFSGATLLSLLLLARSPGGHQSLPNDHLASSRQWTRAWWCATMVLPVLLWLAGLCVEVTWRFGILPGGSVEPSGAVAPVPTWRLPLISGIIALLILFLISSARSWFGQARLRGVRVGLIWAALTALGLAIGGFALPWNSLLGTSLLSTTPARAGDIWSLLLISATLLGTASLTAPTHRSAAPPLPDGEEADDLPGQSVHWREPAEDDTAITASPRRVINLRPAFLWMLVVLLLLFLYRCGRNPAATTVALLGFGTMWVRLWLERHERPARLKMRRTVMAVVAIAALLLWQRNSTPLLEDTLAAWWPGWLATWSLWWWDVALAATLLGAVAFVTAARPALRHYLRSRYATRAMLAGAAAAALAALLIFGTPGPSLIALYTLGAVFYEVLGTRTPS
ncbi:MAG: hypothetical protein M3347_09605, partial [Armatimonadota bacterium]|nr:hypothetical protein [Armatimonadota bacterium]